MRDGDRCPCRCRTGGCSRSSRCTPARTSATRWPPASGPTAPDSAGEPAHRRLDAAPVARQRRGASRPATTVALAPPSGRRRPRTTIERRAAPGRRCRAVRRARRRLGRGRTRRAPCAGGSRCWTPSRARPADPADAARWSARRCALTPARRAGAPRLDRPPRRGGRSGRRARRRPRSGRPAARRAGRRAWPRPPGRCWPGCAGRAVATGRATGVGSPDVRPRGRAGRAHRRLVRRARRPGVGRARHRRGRHRKDPAGRRARAARRQRRGPRRRRRRASTSAGRPRSRCGRSSRGRWSAVVPPPPERAEWPAELGRLAPDLAGALGRRTPRRRPSRPELERLRLFDAVLRLVEWAAAGRPVLLVAEDVHRADRASLALCAHIGRRLAALPVLFVLTRRDRPSRPDADALLADLAGRGLPVTEIEPRPLRRHGGDRGRP